MRFYPLWTWLSIRYDKEILYFCRNYMLNNFFDIENNRNFAIFAA